ncbi:hypothetical protein ABW20_dc0105544 [Dactylellina cionopaga]|nr:hypothetical protein ABW20_dc0105544 [Dactylellina cionopaga]
MSPTLKKIIEDPNIIKAGVQIRGDMSRLATVIVVNPQGVIELAEFNSLLFAAQKNELETGQKLTGSLTGLSEEHLKLPLLKGEIRTSDWSAPMSEEQKIYAANDVYASFKVFDVLDEIRRSLDPRPALPPTYSFDHSQTVDEWHHRVAVKKLAEAKAKKAEEDGVPKKPTAIRVPKDPSPELAKAYDWIKEYAKTVPGQILTAAVADLRCYSLWQHQKMEAEEVAAICRDPPLVTGYVATRILDAIRLEKELPYNPRRLLWVLREVPKEGLRRYYYLKVEAITKLKEKEIFEDEDEGNEGEVEMKITFTKSGSHVDGDESPGRARSVSSGPKRRLNEDRVQPVRSLSVDSGRKYLEQRKLIRKTFGSNTFFPTAETRPKTAPIKSSEPNKWGFKESDSTLDTRVRRVESTVLERGKRISSTKAKSAWTEVDDGLDAFDLVPNSVSDSDGHIADKAAPTEESEWPSPLKKGNRVRKGNVQVGLMEETSRERAKLYLRDSSKSR